MRSIRLILKFLLSFCVLGFFSALRVEAQQPFNPPSAYKDNYILVGQEHDQVEGRSDFTSVKLKLSLRKDLIDQFFGEKGKPFGEAVPLYFGFTELGFWDVGRKSLPFRELIFRPELFFELLGKTKADEAFDPGIKKTGFRRLPLGLLHESNGRGGEESRSWNRLYIEPNFSWSPNPRWELRFNWQVWWAFGRAPENRDIEDFYGYNEWNLKAAYQAYQLAARFRYGRDNKGQALLDFSGPFRDLKYLAFLKGYWHIQYFEGYGETLLDYNVKDSELRFGFMFSR